MKNRQFRNVRHSKLNYFSLGAQHQEANLLTKTKTKAKAKTKTKRIFMHTRSK